MKPRTLRNANLVITSQEPHGEKKRMDVLVLVWEENPVSYSRKNPSNQVGTENPIHSAPGGI